MTGDRAVLAAVVGILLAVFLGLGLLQQQISELRRQCVQVNP